MGLEEGQVITKKWVHIYRRGGVVVKEKIIPEYGRGKPWHERHIQEVYERLLGELKFFSDAFLGFVPRTEVQVGEGKFAARTVLVVQDYIQGQTLADCAVTSDPSLVDLFARVLEIYATHRRMPDLHSASLVPNPWRTENVIASGTGVKLVDVEDLGGRWRADSVRGALNCGWASMVIGKIQLGKNSRSQVVKSVHG